MILSLSKIPAPIQKNKYIILDMSKLKGINLDVINNVLSVDVGFSCG